MEKIILTQNELLAKMTIALDKTLEDLKSTKLENAKTKEEIVRVVEEYSTFSVAQHLILAMNIQNFMELIDKGEKDNGREAN